MKRKIIIIVACFVLLANNLQAQGKFKSKVVDVKNAPVAGAVITVKGGSQSAVSSANGEFVIELPAQDVLIKVEAAGYNANEARLSAGYKPEVFVLNSVSEYSYNQSLTLDEGLQSKLTGLRVVRKSGMPGEGAYLNIRGLHTLVAENYPMLVVNGVPYFSNDNMSLVINGYSGSLLSAFNVSDISSVKILKGGAAGIYGSLGSNGVVMIETQQAKSDNLETRITYTGNFGINSPGRKLPLLDASQYSEYLRNAGMTRYSQMSSLYADYPFLRGDNDYYENFIFNNNTNWQDVVLNNSTSSNNVLRVEGGDEIAKYNMSVGYTSEGGTMGDTKSDRYNTLINSNILVSRKVNIFTTVGLSYIKSKLAEQGMTEQTNPLIAAYYSMPQLNPYKSDDKGRLSGTLAPYDYSNVNNNPAFPYQNVSNPLALVRSVEADQKRYDVNINLGINYNINEYLGLVGVYNHSYRYTEENMFIPGITGRTILPQYYGIGKNTVRKGITEYKNRYFGVEANYNRVFDYVHELSVKAGSKYMTYGLEYDMSSGYNTANDFYQTLGYTTDEDDINGFNDAWVWLNHSINMSYTYNRILNASFNASLDGTSVSGSDSPRYYLYPSAGLTLMLAQTGILPESISLLNLSLEASKTGNSRFSSNYSKNYYQNSNFFTLGTITRSNVPNTYLQPEKQNQLSAGLDFSAINGRINLGIEGFTTNSYDLLIARSISSVYASQSYYDNSASLKTNGTEISLNVEPVNTGKFSWILGGDISFVKTIVNDLGDRDQMLLDFSGFNNEDVQVILKKGEKPYQFYGFSSNGVYSTSNEAQSANLKTVYGGKYKAGDVIFDDNYKDGEINEKDKVLLGSASPDYFGSIYTKINYSNWSLQANFHYSVGNMAYNAVRRNLESMSRFNNQSSAVQNRWQLEGQQTNIPRAVYGDPSGNAVFSDRWVEDASYLKLGSLVLSYNIDKGMLKLFRSGKIWISGQNLFTLTNYLGSDPEFAYSYDESMQGFDYGKISLPASVNIGVELNF